MSKWFRVAVVMLMMAMAAPLLASGVWRSNPIANVHDDGLDGDLARRIVEYTSSPEYEALAQPSLLAAPRQEAPHFEHVVRNAVNIKLDDELFADLQHGRMASIVTIDESGDAHDLGVQLDDLVALLPENSRWTRQFTRTAKDLFEARVRADQFHHRRTANLSNWFTITFAKEEDPYALRERLMQSPLVENVEVMAAATPADLSAQTPQWSVTSNGELPAQGFYELMGIPEVWSDKGITGREASITVMTQGIPSSAQADMPPFTPIGNFVANPNEPGDSAALILAGAPGDAVGVTGIAFGAKFYVASAVDIIIIPPSTTGTLAVSPANGILAASARMGAGGVIAIPQVLTACQPAPGGIGCQRIISVPVDHFGYQSTWDAIVSATSNGVLAVLEIGQNAGTAQGPLEPVEWFCTHAHCSQGNDGAIYVRSWPNANITNVRPWLAVPNIFPTNASGAAAYAGVAALIQSSRANFRASTIATPAAPLTPATLRGIGLNNAIAAVRAALTAPQNTGPKLRVQTSLLDDELEKGKPIKYGETITLHADQQKLENHAFYIFNDGPTSMSITNPTITQTAGTQSPSLKFALDGGTPPTSIASHFGGKFIVTIDARIHGEQTFEIKFDTNDNDNWPHPWHMFVKLVINQNDSPTLSIRDIYGQPVTLYDLQLGQWTMPPPPDPQIPPSGIIPSRRYQFTNEGRQDLYLRNFQTSSRQTHMIVAYPIDWPGGGYTRMSNGDIKLESNASILIDVFPPNDPFIDYFHGAQYLDIDEPWTFSTNDPTQTNFNWRFRGRMYPAFGSVVVYRNGTKLIGRADFGSVHDDQVGNLVLGTLLEIEAQGRDVLTKAKDVSEIGQELANIGEPPTIDGKPPKKWVQIEFLDQVLKAEEKVRLAWSIIDWAAEKWGNRRSVYKFEWDGGQFYLVLRSHIIGQGPRGMKVWLDNQPITGTSSRVASQSTSLSPVVIGAPIDLGEVSLGSAIIREFQIENTTTKPLTISEFYTEGDAFVGELLTPSIPVGGRGTFRVTFVANTKGTSTGTVSFRSDTTPASETDTYFAFDITATAKSVSAPVISSFTVNPTAMERGRSATLAWSVTNATDIEIQPNVGRVSASGTRSVSPTTTTTYVLKATKGVEITTSTVTLTVGGDGPAGSPHVASFTASPTALTEPGQASTLTWSVSNATAIRLEPGGEVTGTTSLVVHPNVTTTYVLRATNGVGTSVGTLTVSVGVIPVIRSFTASPQSLAAPGDPTTLTWDVGNANSVTLSPGIGIVEKTGSATLSPQVTTRYTLTATNAGGVVSQELVVNVAGTTAAGSPPVINDFAADTTTISAGQAATLSWSVDGADLVLLAPPLGTPVVSAGSQSVQPAATTTYTLFARNAAGSASRDVTITVNGGAAVPQIQELTVAPQPIEAGGGGELRWTTSNATTAWIEPDIGSVPASGVRSIKPYRDTLYVLNAQNAAGLTSRAVAVKTVNPTPAPLTKPIELLRGDDVDTGVRLEHAGTTPLYDALTGYVSGSMPLQIVNRSGASIKISSATLSGYRSGGRDIFSLNSELRGITLIENQAVSVTLRWSTPVSPRPYGVTLYVTLSDNTVVYHNFTFTPVEWRQETSNTVVPADQSNTIFNYNLPTDPLTYPPDGGFNLGLPNANEVATRVMRVLNKGNKAVTLTQAWCASDDFTIRPINGASFGGSIPAQGYAELRVSASDRYRGATERCNVQTQLDPSAPPTTGTFLSFWVTAGGVVDQPIPVVLDTQLHGLRDFTSDSNATPYVLPRVRPNQPLVVEFNVRNGANDLTLSDLHLGGSIEVSGRGFNLARGFYSGAYTDPPLYTVSGGFRDPVYFKIRFQGLPQQGVYTGIVKIPMWGGTRATPPYEWTHTYEFHLQIQVGRGRVRVNQNDIELENHGGFDADAPTSFTVENISDAPVNLSNLAVPPHYSIVSPLPRSLAPGQTGTFAIAQVKSLEAEGPQMMSFSMDDPDEPSFELRENHRPIAGNDHFEINPDVPLVIDVLENDTDPDGDALSVTSVTALPTKGTVSFTPDGQLQYSATPGQSGNDRFTYEVADDLDGTARADVTVAIGFENHNPVANADAVVTKPGRAITINVTANDTDPDGDPVLLITDPVVVVPLNGTAAKVDGARITYTPNPDFTGTDSFTYEVGDTFGKRARSTVTITVANTKPVARPDSAYTKPNKGVTILVTANDDDPDGDNVTLISDPIVIAPAAGTAQRVDGDNILYIPNAGFSGTDSFTYEVGDGYGSRARAIVTVDVSNAAPVAAADVATTTRSTAVVIDVTANDSDPDGDPVLLISDPVVTAPQRGTATRVDDAHIRYTPQAGAVGTDSFTYEVGDTYGKRARALVTITIKQTGPPVARNDRATTKRDTPVTIDLLANDVDPDGQAITLTASPITTAPAHGTVTRVSNTTVRYTPEATWAGNDVFEYEISDSSGNKDRAWAAVHVGRTKSLPVAVDDNASTEANRSITINVLANDSSPDGDAIALTGSPIIVRPTHGVARRVSGTSVSYTPNSSFAGTDTFAYEISDSEWGTAAAFVTVTVTDSNRPPVAVSDSAATTPGRSVTIDVTANDSDPDGDSVALISNPVIAAPAHGTALRVSAQSIAYTPLAGYTGTDSFQYAIGDGHGRRANALVTITITDTNHPPDAADDDADTPAGVAVTINVVANDSDADGDHPVLITNPIVTAPTHGTAVKVSGTSITYTPANGFTGADRFQYEIGDGHGARARAWVDVNVGSATVNHNPVAVDDDVTTRVNTTVDVNVTANDSDPDGDPVTLITSPVIIAPAHGTVTKVNGATLRFTPVADYVGVDTFQYEVGDGKGKRARAWVHVTVTDGNSRPVAVDDMAFTIPGRAITINVTHNDYDPDGDNVVLIGSPVIVAPTHGTATKVDGANISYQPVAGYSGTDRFQYEIGDQHGARHRAWVNITISTPILGTQSLPEALLRADNDASETKSDEAMPIVVLANDVSFDGKLVVLAQQPIITQPLSGSAVRSSDTAITYTPNAGFRGNDRFEYEVLDAAGNSMRAWVTVQVPGENSAPAAADDDVSVAAEGTTIVLPLGNDHDADGDPIALTERAVTKLPAGGTVHRDSDTQLTYTAGSGFSGVDSFKYEITDGRGGVAEATVVLHVASKRAPVAVNDTAAAFSAVPLTIDVLANDSDPDGDAIAVVSSLPPQHGTFIWNESEGKGTYTSAAGYVGPDSFTYTISDADGLSAQAQVSITVTRFNNAPVANDDAAETNTRTPVLIGVLANDYDLDYPTKLTIVSTTAPAHGTIAINTAQSITYTPGDAFAGSDSFTYTVSDGTATTTAVVAITVLNQAPVPHTDILSAFEDVFIGYSAFNIIGNDSDPDGDELHVTKIEQPQHGTFAISPDNTQFSYRSNENWNGLDSFYYTVSDPFGAEVRVFAQIRVAAVDDEPVPADDAFSVYKNQPLTITPAQVLANDTDLEGDTISIYSISAATNGAAQLLADGTIQYQPYGEYVGADSFTYTVTDSGGSVYATARINVTVKQDTPPVAGFTVTCNDQVCSFDASASSDDRGIVTYDWKFGNGQIGAGKTPVYTYPATGAFLVTLTVTDGINQKGSTSKSVTVTCALPAINAQPTSRTITAGQPATLSVTATKATSYQWYQGTAPSTAIPVGTNAATLTVTPFATTSYWVNVTNGCGSTPSATATVSVCVAPSITTQPASQSITKGSSATLSVTAGGTGPFTYQWYEGATGTTTTPVGTNNNSLTVTPTATKSYWVKVTSGCNGGVASSNTATVTVTIPPVARRQLAAATANSQTSITASWTQPTQAGNLLVAVVSASNVSTIGTITPPSGWQLAASYEWNNIKTAIYYIANNAGGRTSETFTFVHFPDSTLQLAEYTGAMTVAPLDRTAINGDFAPAGGTVTSGTTPATAQAKELVITAFTMYAPVTFTAPTNGFTRIDERQIGYNLTTAYFEKVTGLAGAQSQAAAVSGSEQWLGVMATFKSADTSN